MVLTCEALWWKLVHCQVVLPVTGIFRSLQIFHCLFFFLVTQTTFPWEKMCVFFSSVIDVLDYNITENSVFFDGILLTLDLFFLISWISVLQGQGYVTFLVGPGHCYKSLWDSYCPDWPSFVQFQSWFCVGDDTWKHSWISFDALVGCFQSLESVSQLACVIQSRWSAVPEVPGWCRKIVHDAFSFKGWPC